MPITIEPILNGESGLSVRAKLNQLIAGAGTGDLGPPLPPEWEDITDTTPPGVPQNLALTSIVALTSNLVATWDPVTDTDFAYYDLQMRENGGSWISFQTSAEEHRFTVLPAVTFDARIRAFDKRGNASNFSPIVTHISVGDTIPPAMPIGVVATPGFGTIWLEWTPNTEADLAYYEVYEAASASPAPTLATEATYRSAAASFPRTGYADNVTRHFWVRATDTSGNKSNWSARVQATTSTIDIPDITPPTLGVPGIPVLTSTVAIDGSGTPVLSIQATFTAGLNAVGYDLGVIESGGSEVIFTTGGSPYIFRARAGVLYSVRVRSIGALGNKSAWSTATTLTPAGDTTPPAVPTGLTATGTLKAIWLRWTANTDADLSRYEIYEHTAATPAPAAGSAATYIAYGTSLPRQNLVAGDQRWFWIRAVDVSGNKSAWSSVVTATATVVNSLDIAGAVDLTSVAAGLSLPGSGSALPATPFTTATPKTFYNTTDKKVYVQKTDGTGWIEQGHATLLVGQLQAGQIGANAIGANEIAANAVSARHLLIADTNNLVPDNDMRDALSWIVGSGWTFVTSSPTSGFRTTGLAAFPNQSTTGYSDPLNSQPFAVESGAEYYCAVQSFSTATHGLWARVHWFDGAGALINWGNIVSSNTLAANGVVTSSTNLTAPAGAKTAAVYVYVNRDVQTGPITVAGLQVIKRNAGQLIVDGAIFARHITVDGDFVAKLANIETAYISDAHVLNLDAALIRGGTVLAGSVRIGSAYSLDTMVDKVAAAGFVFGFEPDEWSKLRNVTGYTATAYTADKTQGTQCLRLSNTSTPVAPGGAFNIVDLGIAASSSFYGKRIKVTAMVKQDPSNPSTSFYMGYGVGDGGGTSGWKFFTPTSTWQTFSFYHTCANPSNLPVTVGSGVGFVPDTTNSNKGILIDAVSVVVSSEDLALDPAAQLNVASTLIEPGKILISGTSTLADWRQGGDTTKIAGGAISANTIDANKLRIGMRNLTLEGITFEHNSPSANRVAWSAGTIRYINDAGVTVSAAISANAAGALWSSGVLYVYWTQGATSLSTTTDPATAFASSAVILATYQGGTTLDADYGKTIIDGSDIKTGTVTANQIDVNTIRARNLYISDLNNLAADPYLGDVGSWASASALKVFVVDPGNGYAGRNTYMETTGANSGLNGEYVDVAPGQEFILEAVANRYSATSGSFRVFAQWANDALVSQGFIIIANWTTADALNTWVRKTATGTVPATATKVRILIDNAETTIAGGTYRLGYVALNRRSGAELIVDGAITAAKLSTGELITLSAQIKDAIITSAKIVSLDAAKIQAGSIMSGEVIIGGRSIGDIAAIDTVMDDMTRDRVKVTGAGTGYYSSTSPVNCVTGTRSFVSNDDGAAYWMPANILIPFDPSKLYKVTFKIRRGGVVGGNMFMGVRGYAADQTTPVQTDGASGTNGHFVVASPLAQTAIAASLTDYVGWIKGSAATGTHNGTIAVPAKMHTSVRYITPYFIVNSGAAAGAGATIIVDSIKIETIDENGAALINAGTVKITPGQVEISGATTLADWRQGGDVTRIAGGAISANTIDANKLTIGQRNIKVEGLQFEHNSPSANRVAWSAGTIRYINDAGTLVSTSISAWTTGSLWSSGVLYIYWTQGATFLTATTTAATAFAANNVVLAAYRGGTDLAVDIGRTIIDGSSIKTGTITADRILTYNLTAANATFANGIITNAMIGNAAITSTKLCDLTVRQR